MVTIMDEAITKYPKLPQKISHAYITSAPLAKQLATAVVCQSADSKPCMACAHCDKASRNIHPDISILEKLPEKREITIDQIRELKKDVLVLPNEAAKKAYMISSADVMNTAAQNALLAILEEPPRHVVFILETENHMALLPTVRSRCVRLSSDYEQNEDIDEAVQSLTIDFVSAIIQNKNLALAEIMFKIEKLEKHELLSMILLTREKIADAYRKTDSNSTTALQQLIKAEKMLIKANEYLELNVNKGHVAGLMCASLMA